MAMMPPIGAQLLLHLDPCAPAIGDWLTLLRGLWWRQRLKHLILPYDPGHWKLGSPHFQSQALLTSPKICPYCQQCSVFATLQRPAQMPPSEDAIHDYISYLKHTHSESFCLLHPNVMSWFFLFKSSVCPSSETEGSNHVLFWISNQTRHFHAVDVQ